MNSTASGDQLINPSTNQLINYTLHLADNALILCQRNAEWTGHGPVLEQDIAISNIALDLIGQARNLYQYAAVLMNESGSSNNITEDSLAYFRDAGDFKNCLLVELPKGDWATTVLRQFFFSAYQFYLYKQLGQSADKTIAAIAEKSIKETTYHLRWSAEWVIRLGDGTAESNERINTALKDLWPYTGELFTASAYETSLFETNTAAEMNGIKLLWQQKAHEVFKEATLAVPTNNRWQTGGKEGRHTEHLHDILADMQYLQRTYPGNEW